MSEYIKEIMIDSYDELIKIIQGKTNHCENLREKFIFRGLADNTYKLIPSALRYEDEKKETKIINDYILDSEFQFNMNKQLTFVNSKGEEKIGTLYASIDKDEKPILEKPKYTVKSEGELQFKREIYVLLKFLDYADKIGLKIPTNASIRQWIHNSLEYSDNEEIWPKSEFYDIISLAQHHHLPTRALDWSYDYKIALFFAVRNILKDKDMDCILWAFNYKVFEEKNITKRNIDKKEGLIVYRPEYNVNPNLKAQQGLFTFWASNDYINMDDDTPFDRLLTKKIMKMKSKNSNKIRFNLNGMTYEIDSEEKIFYKIIIPSRVKAKILKELYLEGYSHENIFPNYYGVVNSIKNRVKLEKILNKKSEK